MLIRMNWIKPVKIFLDVIEPPLLTLGAAPQTAESLTVFCVQRDNNANNNDGDGDDTNQEFSIGDDCCVNGKV